MHELVRKIDAPRRVSITFGIPSFMFVVNDTDTTTKQTS